MRNKAIYIVHVTPKGYRSFSGLSAHNSPEAVAQYVLFTSRYTNGYYDSKKEVLKMTRALKIGNHATYRAWSETKYIISKIELQTVRR